MAAILATSCARSQLGPPCFCSMARWVKSPVSVLYVPGPSSLFYVYVEGEGGREGTKGVRLRPDSHKVSGFVRLYVKVIITQPPLRWPSCNTALLCTSQASCSVGAH